MTTEDTVRQYYKCLNHQRYGQTELVVTEKDSGRIVATGFFDNKDDFCPAGSTTRYAMQCLRRQGPVHDFRRQALH